MLNINTRIKINNITFVTGFLTIFGVLFHDEFFLFNPSINRTFGIILSVLILYQLIKDNQLTTFVLNNEVLIWLLFLISVSITGALISQNKISHFGMIFYLFQQTMITFFIIITIKYEKNITKILLLFTFMAFFQLIIIVTNGSWELLLPRIDKAIYDIGNANGLGNLFFIGIISLLFLYDYTNNRFMKFINLSIIFVFILQIINTGSRKVFIGLIIFFVASFFFNYVLKKKKNLRRMIFWNISIVVAGIVIVRIITPFISNNSLLGIRFNLLGNDMSSYSRLVMYKEGIKMWSLSPVFGYGFDQFRFYSITKLYSHSNYIEILFSGGLVGFTLYYLIYYYIIKKLLYIRKIVIYKSLIWKQSGYFLSLVIYQLFIGLGAVQYFSFLTWTVISMVIGYVNQNIKTLRSEG